MKNNKRRIALALLLLTAAFLPACKKESTTTSNASNTETFWSSYSYSGSVGSFIINKNNWFIGTDAGLSVSVNQGTSFSTYNYPTLPSSQVTIVRAGASGEIYELLNDGTLLRSDDNGATYLNIGNNLNSATIQYIKFHSIDIMPNGDVWCGVLLSQSSGPGTIGENEEALAKSTDKGQTWTFPAGLNAANSAVEKVAADSKGNLYGIVSSSSVAKSADGGKTWNYVYPSGGIVVVNDLYVNSKDQVFVAGDRGLNMSDNSGSSFQNVALPADLTSSYLENVLSSTNGNLFVTTKTTLVDHTADKTSNCYYSNDGGHSWHNIPNVPSARVIWLQGFDSNGHLLGKYATAAGTGICVSTGTF
jgi:Sortilin, neurotensin receptor 3,